MPLRPLRCLSLPALLLALTGCTTLPSQEMADARQAIEAAAEAGADEGAPELLEQAQAELAVAATRLETGAYAQAAERAMAARDAAVAARSVTMALQAARDRLAAADRLGSLSPDSAALLARAEAAAARGDVSAAVALAAAAEQQGQLAVARHHLEVARLLLMRLEGTAQSLNPRQRALLVRLRRAYAERNARAAHTLTRELEGELASSDSGAPAAEPVPTP